MFIGNSCKSFKRRAYCRLSSTSTTSKKIENEIELKRNKIKDETEYMKYSKTDGATERYVCVDKIQIHFCLGKK